jgi:membrane-associated protein
MVGQDVVAEIVARVARHASTSCCVLRLSPARHPGYRDGVIDDPAKAKEAAAALAETTEPETTEPEGTEAEARPPTDPQTGEPVPADAEKSPWDDPRLPWSGKPRRVDIICWALIVGSGLFVLALLPFRAALVGTHPVLGEFLNGSTESIIAAAAFARVGKGSLAVAILVAFPGIMKFDLVWWWAGHLWGEKIFAMVGRRRDSGAKHLARIRKWGWRFSWPLVIISDFQPIPTSIIYAAVGVAGMSFVTFVLLDLIASALWIGLLVGLGYVLGHRAVSIATTISHYGLWIAVGIVALVIIGQVRASRRKS